MRKKAAPAKPAKPRVTLNREAIAEAALALIDAEGLSVFSMRRLGTRLGVEAMALYHHFKSKGELFDAVMEQLLKDVNLPPRGTLPALARLRRFAESYRQIAVRHPNAFILLTYRRFNTEPTFMLYEQILEAFADLGFDPALSARFFRYMGYYAGGAGLADIASRAQQPDATQVQLEKFKDRDRYPHIAAVAPHLRVSNLDAIYQFGLDAIFREMEKESAARLKKRKG